MSYGRQEKKPQVLKEVLKAFLPYSKNNLLLSYSPNKFFNELERKTGANRSTLRSTISRAKKRQLVMFTESKPPCLTWRGKIKAGYLPAAINANGVIIVVFDIPEAQRQARYLFRTYLKMMQFRPIQKSVWLSSYEAEVELLEVIQDLALGENVCIFRGENLYPSQFTFI